MMEYARFVPPPNDQRTDPEWNWDGVRIVGNSMCQGNSNEDVLKAVGMEFQIRDFEKINTYNYYAIYFAFLKKFDPNTVTRPEMMDWRNHASCLQFYISENKLPVKVVCYSSIGDKARKQDLVEIKKFDGSAQFLSNKLLETKRVCSVGTLELPAGHWRRFHATDDIKKLFEENNPYGKFPFKTPEEKKHVTNTTSWETAEKSKIRRITAIEDL